MAASTFQHALGTVKFLGWDSSPGSQNGISTFSVKMVSKDFGLDMRLLKRGNCSSGSCKLRMVHALASHSSVADPVQAPSNQNSSDSQKKTSKSCTFCFSFPCSREFKLQSQHNFGIY